MYVFWDPIQVHLTHHNLHLRGALDEGPRGKVQQNGVILFVESSKLDLRPLDKDRKPIKPI
jgi:hypothetical protein